MTQILINVIGFTLTIFALVVAIFQFLRVRHNDINDNGEKRGIMAEKINQLEKDNNDIGSKNRENEVKLNSTLMAFGKIETLIKALTDNFNMQMVFFKTQMNKIEDRLDRIDEKFEKHINP